MIGSQMKDRVGEDAEVGGRDLSGHYPSNVLEGLRKRRRYLSKDSQLPG
jgi:hypothetical protein